MADDGLLLNFSVNETPANHLQKFKGGSWRERLQAKRDAKRGTKPRQNDPNKVPIKSREPQSQTPDLAETRPAKRRRENGYTPPFSEPGSQSRPQGQKRNEANTTAGPREVISSLFTYNPKSTLVSEPQENQQEETPAIPSNAPLVDGIDTFTSLGLSPTIATHLLTKMNLKAPTAIQKASIIQMLKEDSDAFVQSETGSGKTLAYLLPVVQRIMTLSEQASGQNKTVHDPSLHRDSGLFAIILAPTRELCKQISVVLERLLGAAHYIVAGTVIGGEKKKSEKARLRKGLNILVATPGRLVDHLAHTKVLDVSSVRWLVLDEGDRLMDLGFEEDITKIVKTLDQKKRKTARPGLPDRRTTILCSATLKMNVQKLGEISLKDAVLIKGDSDGQDEHTGNQKGGVDSAFLAPAQLKQSYLVSATKLRLVTLTALLKRTFARKGSVMKAIVFVSCADSVEFHFKAFRRSLEKAPENQDNPEGTHSSGEDDQATNPAKAAAVVDADSISPSPALSTPQNPVTLYKLHGSLPQATRTNIVRQFANTTSPSLLIATDVASRGLDLPNLDLVIEYDPAFSSDDHLHRIGRTARLGRDGRAIIFLLPGKEEGYVEVLRQSYRQTSEADTSRNVTHTAADDVLKKGFSPVSGVISTKNNRASKISEQNLNQSWETIATEFQLSIERWVLSDPKIKDLAKRAFQSHVRAYATHIAAERKWFDIKDLHLGHLAKAFGLRDAPGRVNLVGQGRSGAGGKSSRARGGNSEGQTTNSGAGGAGDGGEPDESAKKMREKVRLNRKLMMGGGGADEFNIA
ncbi:uncharacterized protein A1O9_09987 [Exophiala aquamarina CBS 119918]|uniref:ATP-dependent RNA helicase n=1 Tax=Exophiala aquamarina CBS 119918 TaxID=1182545 RepID=A0A072P3B2_9EURO|nr:uncharacterized protein A1O9_09987 [Exophiala aquamarina CBS 119918]KEF54192.1 hypothetical protein A1O9_09987 [Exophiala aquamarina CBS 119918]